MQNYDLVIFDMDGTLADTALAHKKMFVQFWKKFFPQHSHIDVIGNGRGQTMLSVFKSAGLSNQEISDVFDKLEEYYSLHSDNIVSKLSFVEGSVPVIHKLIENGVQVGMVSNSLQELVSKVVRKNGMEKEFSIVLGAHRDAADKKERFFNILKETGFAANRVLYVGDAELDVCVAHDCGMDCCILYTPIAWLHSADCLLNQHDPDFVIKDISKLLKIVL